MKAWENKLTNFPFKKPLSNISTSGYSTSSNTARHPWTHQLSHKCNKIQWPFYNILLAVIKATRPTYSSPGLLFKGNYWGFSAHRSMICKVTANTGPPSVLGPASAHLYHHPCVQDEDTSQIPDNQRPGHGSSVQSQLC